MQCYAEKQALGEVSQDLLDTQVNPAVWEISGHIVLKRRTDFEEASEDSAWRLLAEVSLSEERFEEVKACIFQAAGLTESDDEEETLEKHNDMVQHAVDDFKLPTQLVQRYVKGSGSLLTWNFNLMFVMCCFGSYSMFFSDRKSVV